MSNTALSEVGKELNRPSRVVERIYCIIFIWIILNRKLSLLIVLSKYKEICQVHGTMVSLAHSKTENLTTHNETLVPACISAISALAIT